MKKYSNLISVLIAAIMLFTLLGVPLPRAVVAGSENPSQPEATNAMPAPTIVFPGLSREDNPADPDIFPSDPTLYNDPRVIGAVPDTSGAAGHTHYLQAVNKMVALYRKDGTVVDSVSFGSFWSQSATDTLCSLEGGIYHHGQPYVMYDHLSGRWVVADVAYSDIDNGPYYLCVAVSNGLTPPAPGNPYFIPDFWYYYALKTNVENLNFYPDSPKLGLWPDGYYLAADMVDVYNNGMNRTPRGIKVWALNREDLIGGNEADYRTKSFYLSEQLGYEHLVPSNLIGLPPATGTPNYFASIQPGKFHVWEFHADWNELSPSTFGTSPAHLPNYTLDTDTSSIWAIGYIVPENNPTEKLDVHGERLMSPLQYRIVDGVPSLWATHAVLSDSVVGMRWYEIRYDSSDEPFFYQKGTYQPDNRYRWLGSLAVDQAGDMALGYSVSNASMHPAIRYAGRLKSDPTGQLAQGEAVLQVAGFPVYNGSQYDGDLLFDGPWGRQSQMSVDPLDECIFWYTNMYYDSNSGGTNWHTAIGWFGFPECKGGVTKRISLHTDDTQGNASSGLDFEMYSVGISETGRYVVFSSEATNLVDDDTNGQRDVFLRDRDTDNDQIYDEPGSVKTTRISMGYDGSQTNGDSWEVAISADSKFIAYSSDASNIVSGDTNGARDVFVYNRTTGVTERVSVVNATTNGNGNAQSDQPFLSRTGRYVVFRSFANNLVTGDTNTVADIFLRDRNTKLTMRIPPPDISISFTEPDAESTTPTISDDGTRVAFASRATNLVTTPADNADGNALDVFVYDRSAGDTYLISAVGNLTDTLDSYTPYISGDGNYVAFASRSWSLDTDTTNWEAPTDTDADIFVYDLTLDVISRVSVNFFGVQAANGDSFSPSITRDGRFIAFASEANNLDVNLPDVNARRDIFLHDRTLALSGVYDFGLTQRISLNYNRGEPNDWSFVPVIAPEGRHVAYVSEASNLVNNDTNNAWDVFAFDSQRHIPTFLTIPANIPGSLGEVVSVPVIFNQSGQTIDTTTFSVDFDQTCLIFDPTLTDAVVFNVPADFVTSWSYSAADKDGELDFSIYDQTAPRTPVPDGTLVTFKLKVKATCSEAPGSANSARVGFSTDPSPSFGSNGQSVKGYSSDGFIHILPAMLGDCNGDGLVDAGDLSALVLEIFDGDNTLPSNTPGGTFPGNPVGCNPNQDTVVDAGDLSCTVLIIWGDGTAACSGGAGPTSQITSPTLFSSEYGTATPGLVSLDIPNSVPALPGDRVTLPLSFHPNGNAVNSMIFSIDYDQTWLTFDPADKDHDGLPDALSLDLPQGFKAIASFDPNDSHSELDVVIFNPTSPTASLTDKDLLALNLTTGNPPGDVWAMLQSSDNPPASFGSVDGQSLPGGVDMGSVLITLLNNRIYLPLTMGTPSGR